MGPGGVEKFPEPIVARILLASSKRRMIALMVRGSALLAKVAPVQIMYPMIGSKRF